MYLLFRGAIRLYEGNNGETSSLYFKSNKNTKVVVSSRVILFMVVFSGLETLF